MGHQIGVCPVMFKHNIGLFCVCRIWCTKQDIRKLAKVASITLCSPNVFCVPPDVTSDRVLGEDVNCV